MPFSFSDFYYNIFLNRIVSSAVIFFVGFMLGKIAGTLAKRILHEIDFNRIASKVLFARINFEKTISKTISGIIYLVTIFAVLNRLGITQFVLIGILVFLVIIIVSSALLDLKDLAPKIYGWAMIKRKKFFSEGDWIKTPLAEGTVKRVGLTETKIITEQGDEIFIPNSKITEDVGVKKSAKKPT